MEPTHTRKETWKGSPFTSIEEVADLLETLGVLVTEAGSRGVIPSARVSYDDREYVNLRPDELRELAPALTLDDATAMLTATPQETEFPVGVEVLIFGAHGSYPSVNLTVTGKNEVAVNGLLMAMKQRIGDLVDRKAQAENLAAQREQENAPPPRWKRVLNNPWTIHIGTGLILFALGLLIGSR